MHNSFFSISLIPHTFFYWKHTFCYPNMLISHEVTFLDDKFAIGITNLTFSKPRYSRSITLNIIDVQLLNRVPLFSTPWTYARLPCPSPSPRACSNSYPFSQWCHPTISSSVVPFFSCLQFFPVSGSFLMSWFFASGDQGIGVSASASVLPMNVQYWFPLGWTGWISLQSKGLSREIFNTTIQKHQFFGAQPSLQSNSHIHTWLLKKS